MVRPFFPSGRNAADRPAGGSAVSGTVRATRQAEYTVISKTETYGSFETQGRHADRRIRHARDALAAPTEFIPKGKTPPEVAYQMVKEETYPQTQPRLNLATFVTTYMDDHATRLMNEAINVNYIDETEYPRVAVMCGRCINILANLWNTPEKAAWKTGAPGIGSSEACMLGGVAAWLRWRAAARPPASPATSPIW